MTDDLEIRRMTDADEPAVVDMLAGSLGWMPDDLHRGFFRWKHFDNPAGPSPTWLAVDGDRIAGVRVLLRWRFVDGDGRRHDAVRAVDTATDPDYRGRGIFTRLTMAAVDELTTAGIGFVFNTPNDQSRPGYLKMGWAELGRVPIAMRPSGPSGLARMLRARTPAELWSEDTGTHDPASEVLADSQALEELLATVRRPNALATDRTPAHLRWRYGFEPLHYRAVTLGRDLADGLAIYRLRRRGAALEAAVCEILVPEHAHRAARRLITRILADSPADYAVAMSAGPLQSFVPVPGQGPILTRRPLAEPEVGTIDDFALGLGDIELF